MATSDFRRVTIYYVPPKERHNFEPGTDVMTMLCAGIGGKSAAPMFGATSFPSKCRTWVSVNAWWGRGGANSTGRYLERNRPAPSRTSWYATFGELNQCSRSNLRRALEAEGQGDSKSDPIHVDVNTDSNAKQPLTCGRRIFVKGAQESL